MESDQDIQLKALRPLIPQAEVNEKTTSTETFQNQTLRPVIKFLNHTLLLTIKHNLDLFDKNHSNLPFDKKIDSLRTFLEKNQKIRVNLQGMIVGFLTKKELDEYFKNKSEFNKRIMQMIEQRAVDHLDFF